MPGSDQSMNDEILATVNEISQIAAETALSYFRKTLDISLKGDHSPVTAAGHVDAVVDYDAKPFDYLPLAGLIEAAGGIMTEGSWPTCHAS